MIKRGQSAKHCLFPDLHCCQISLTRSFSVPMTLEKRGSTTCTLPHSSPCVVVLGKLWGGGICRIIADGEKQLESCRASPLLLLLLQLQVSPAEPLPDHPQDMPVSLLLHYHQHFSPPQHHLLLHCHR